MRAGFLLFARIPRSAPIGTAAPHLQRALDLRVKSDVPDRPWLAQARIARALACLDAGEVEAARSLLTLAAQAHAHQPRLGEHLTRPLEEALVLLQGKHQLSRVLTLEQHEQRLVEAVEPLHDVLATLE